MAQVGRNDDTDDGCLVVRRRGRWPDFPDGLNGPIKWYREGTEAVVVDPRWHTEPHGRPVPVICSDHPNSRPFLWMSDLRPYLDRGERNGPERYDLDHHHR